MILAWASPFNININFSLMQKNTLTQGANINFFGKQTRRVVKGWALESISTYFKDHNPGAQPCKSTTENWQEANNGGHYRKNGICQYLAQYFRYFVFKVI